MKCPHCRKDIRDAVVVKANAAIVAKRRRKHGKQITSERAKILQALGVAARLARKNAKEQEIEP